MHDVDMFIFFGPGVAIISWSFRNTIFLPVGGGKRILHWRWGRRNSPPSGSWLMLVTREVAYNVHGPIALKQTLE